MSKNGPSGIRTHDHLVKSQMLYRAELRAPGGIGEENIKIIGQTSTFIPSFSVSSLYLFLIVTSVTPATSATSL
jgi:hypothetical protein